jgi:putative ubiquitin-RnfH superfamily antitoxin RatB of RatAB toxin-antitoxin module
MATLLESAGVEVVYALPDRQRLVEVPLREGMTAWQAIEASGILVECPELAGPPVIVGIFGQRVEPSHALRDGDRVEIYRPLVNDPREQRRRRAVAQGRRPAR